MRIKARYAEAEISDEAELERSQADAIAQALRVTARPGTTNSPTSVRLSEPLLEHLDRIAKAQNRKRGNLIQHILWEYIRAHV